MTEPVVITLKEYVPCFLERHGLSDRHAQLLYEQCDGRISVEAPGPATDFRWKLVSNGWVGHWPICEDLVLSLEPRIPLGNIFRMFEYAYQFEFQMLEGMTACSSLREFYERLANVLAKRVLDRGRRGFYRTYVEWEERIPHVRGRVDLHRVLRRPWDATVPCHFEEHTADIEDNAILAGTLAVIARSGLCTPRIAPTVRKAYRAIAGLAPSRGLSANDCLGRLYNRLNQDYQPMHALCRFFLEHRGPTHETGDREMIPFVVNMSALFEKFVAAWVAAHLPADLDLVQQHSVRITVDGEIRIYIDMVIRDALGQAIYVLDTKYKIHDQAKVHDIEQVVAYAVAMNCDRAVLVYPKDLVKPVDLNWEKVRVKSTTFDVSGDLESAGMRLLGSLQAELNHSGHSDL